MEDLYGTVVDVISLVVKLIVYGGGLWFVVELAKNGINVLGELGPEKLNFSLGGKKTWFLAAFIAMGYVLNVDISYLSDFDSLSGVDADFVKTINAALLAIGANTWHDRVFGT